jgi:hypothetical protein
MRISGASRRRLLLVALLRLAELVGAQPMSLRSSMQSFFGSNAPRTVYFIRHGEAYKNTATSSAEANLPQNDRLTNNGSSLLPKRSSRLAANGPISAQDGSRLLPQDAAWSLWASKQSFLRPSGDARTLRWQSPSIMSCRRRTWIRR